MEKVLVQSWQCGLHEWNAIIVDIHHQQGSLAPLVKDRGYQLLKFADGWYVHNKDGSYFFKTVEDVMGLCQVIGLPLRYLSEENEWKSIGG